jgi:hypothetical protein
MKLNSKTIMRFFKMNLSTWKIIGYLLIFVIISLAISLYFTPLRIKAGIFNEKRYKSYNHTKEGLLSGGSITTIMKELEKYNKEVDTICADVVKKISGITVSNADSIRFQSILGDERTNNIAKLDSITALNSTNDDVKAAIANANGQKYIATLNMLNTLNKDSYTDDEAFTELLKQKMADTLNIVNGTNSVYYQLKDYVKTIKV